LWNAQPSIGPPESWTVHGLWPDNCDATYKTNCDPTRDYGDIAGLLTQNEAEETLTFMKEYWIDRNGANEHFWEHEWSKHGTCMSTLQPHCLPEGSPRGLEAVYYFQTVQRLFQSIPLFTWLEDQGILPTTKPFRRDQLLEALRSKAGVTPALGCEHGKLTTIDFYFHVKGSAIDGKFILIDAPNHGNCPSAGIQYLPKSRSVVAVSHSERVPQFPGVIIPSHSQTEKAQKTIFSDGFISAKEWLREKVTALGLLY
jgi:ribonuclease T2